MGELRDQGVYTGDVEGQAIHKGYQQTSWWLGTGKGGGENLFEKAKAKQSTDSLAAILKAKGADRGELRDQVVNAGAVEGQSINRGYLQRSQ